MNEAGYSGSNWHVIRQFSDREVCFGTFKMLVAQRINWLMNLLLFYYFGRPIY